MSVLRKRSPWIIPAASLLLGTLTLGLAGCGGGGDSFPEPTPEPRVITLPAGVTPPIVTATTPTPVVRGEGATVTATAVPDETGGVTGVRVVIPPGAIQENATLAVEVIPEAQSLLEKARQANPNSVAGIEAVTELAFGQVDENGRINTSRPIVFGSGGTTITVSLRGGEFGQLNAAIQSGRCALVVRRFVEGQGLVPVTDCTAALDRNDQTIVLTGNCSGEIIVTCDRLHPQGGFG